MGLQHVVAMTVLAVLLNLLLSFGEEEKDAAC